MEIKLLWYKYRLMVKFSSLWRVTVSKAGSDEKLLYKNRYRWRAEPYRRHPPERRSLAGVAVERLKARGKWCGRHGGGGWLSQRNSMEIWLLSHSLDLRSFRWAIRSHVVCAFFSFGTFCKMRIQTRKQYKRTRNDKKANGLQIKGKFRIQ